MKFLLSTLRCALIAVVMIPASRVCAQIEITEIMFNPISETIWEWVEIRNTSGGAINLDGWILDDDDDPNLDGPNILSADGNTIVSAGGAAVLYNAAALNFDPTRFTNAWGTGITLIPVNDFSPLAANDAVGLWNSQSNYDADDLMSTSSPRRAFNSAVTSVSFAVSNGYPNPTNGRSIAWNGSGSIGSPGNWVSSTAGVYNARTSAETTLPGTPINDVDDRGTPGTVPGGAAPLGLLITEIMYDPRSSEPAWEWVEVYNNTGSTIDFAATPYVLDDDDDSSLSGANLGSGIINNQSTAVLFNGAANSLTNMQEAWGSDINFIPVTSWTDLANDGDTLAIWNSLSAYQSEAQSTTSPRRTTNNATAVVAYDDNTMLGWPNSDGDGSIFLSDLGAGPATPESWLLSDDTNSVGPEPVNQTVVDHPGGDVGSPGYAPGTVAATLPGDYSNNGVVDAADFVLWRRYLNAAKVLPNDNTPGFVSAEDYGVWRANFARTLGSGTHSVDVVPEPASAVLLLLSAAGLYGRRIAKHSPSRRAIRERLNNR